MFCVYICFWILILWNLNFRIVQFIILMVWIFEIFNFEIVNFEILKLYICVCPSCTKPCFFSRNVCPSYTKPYFSAKTPKSARVDTWTTLEICPPPGPNARRDEISRSGEPLTPTKHLHAFWDDGAWTKKCGYCVCHEGRSSGRLGWPDRLTQIMWAGTVQEPQER